MRIIRIITVPSRKNHSEESKVNRLIAESITLCVDSYPELKVNRLQSTLLLDARTLLEFYLRLAPARYANMYISMYQCMHVYICSKVLPPCVANYLRSLLSSHVLIFIVPELL